MMNSQGSLQAKKAPLRETLAIQNAVIGGLIMREIYARFGRDNIGFLWMIVEPALFTTGVICLWALSNASNHSETPLVPFLLTGYMPLLVYRHVVAISLRCMQSNFSLLYYRRVTVLSIYFSKFAVEVVGTITSFVICMVYFSIFDLVRMPHDIGLMIAGWSLYIWFSIALAILIGALSERAEIVEKIWGPTSYISIPTTGAFFMLYWLPGEAREVLLYFPLISASEMIRGGYFGPKVPVFYDAGYAIAVCFCLTVLGMYFLKSARRYLEIG